ncbi:iron-containing redox enzyme family protein [Prescottella sp. R16]|uniref:iron-containing redox enzyme family protein n=1 Tax=Prescottella sp. R16 TaxID=3064529 RepID=UPI00272EC642|nr:iron-containing redox enzyme family protein [Prescottella sp. R16]
MPEPQARGPLSAAVLDVVTGRSLPREFPAPPLPDAPDVLTDDDLQLTLTVLYELHLAGIVGVDASWEWDPALLALRRRLEAVFDGALHALSHSAVTTARTEFGDDVAAALWDMTAPTTTPGLSGFLAHDADPEQFREFLVHRSLNQLREADVHTWGIPRLQGPPKAALVEIQSDEYGGGRYEHMHARLFANTMRALGLSPGYAHYVDATPAVTLSSLNALSYFGFHRRLLPALIGHLCAVETTSALPAKKIAAGLSRLGYGSDATTFFDVHVEADSAHEQIAVRELAGGFVAGAPDSLDGVLFGAATCLGLDDLVGEHMLRSWSGSESSLRRPL